MHACMIAPKCVETMRRRLGRCEAVVIVPLERASVTRMSVGGAIIVGLSMSLVEGWTSPTRLVRASSRTLALGPPAESDDHSVVANQPDRLVERAKASDGLAFPDDRSRG